MEAEPAVAPNAEVLRAAGLAPEPARRRVGASSTVVKALVGVASLLLLVAAGLLLFLMLRDDGGDPPTQEAIDRPSAIVEAAGDGSTRVIVDVGFAGSVDNIALYANGSLVDQAGELGGELVWDDVPDGTHSVVLRAQTGALVLIGQATEFTVGGQDADSDPDTSTAGPDDATPATDNETGQTTTSPTTAAATTTAAPTSTTSVADSTGGDEVPGPYVAVLASLPKATVDANAADTSGASLAAEIGVDGHRIIDSDAWASLRDGFWVVATDADFDTIEDAAALCWALGARDAGTCFGRPVTQNPADLTRVAPPAP